MKVVLACMLLVGAVAGSAVAGGELPVPVSEPISLSLLAAGAGGLLLARRLVKRRK